MTLTGCATGYFKKNFLGNYGYQETRVSDNTYIVKYRANDMTTPVQTYQYALRRSAELTLSNGYSHFNVINKNAIDIRGTRITEGSYEPTLEREVVLKIQFTNATNGQDAKKILSHSNE